MYDLDASLFPGARAGGKSCLRNPIRDEDAPSRPSSDIQRPASLAKIRSLSWDDKCSSRPSPAASDSATLVDKECSHLACAKLTGKRKSKSKSGKGQTWPTSLALRLISPPPPPSKKRLLQQNGRRWVVDWSAQQTNAKRMHLSKLRASAASTPVPLQSSCDPGLSRVPFTMGSPRQQSTQGLPTRGGGVGRVHGAGDRG